MRVVSTKFKFAVPGPGIELTMILSPNPRTYALRYLLMIFVSHCFVSYYFFHEIYQDLFHRSRWSPTGTRQISYSNQHIKFNVSVNLEATSFFIIKKFFSSFIPRHAQPEVIYGELTRYLSKYFPWFLINLAAWNIFKQRWTSQSFKKKSFLSTASSRCLLKLIRILKTVRVILESCQISSEEIRNNYTREKFVWEAFISNISIY